MDYRIAVFLVLFVLLLSGCAEEKPQNKVDVQNNDVVPANQNNQQQPETFDEKYNFCFTKENVQAKDTCIQSLAVEADRDYLCDELTNLDSEKCKRLVWKAFVVLSNEIDKCNSLLTEFDKISCLKEIALLSSDKSVCLKITDFGEKNGCLTELAVQEKDLTVCDSVVGSAKNTCKFNSIVAIADPSLCDSFDLPIIKFSCISAIAKNTDNFSLCSEINDLSVKRDCEANTSP